MNRKPCTVEGCGRTSAARGWCDKHWARWRRTGDPLGSTRKRSAGSYTHGYRIWSENGKAYLEHRRIMEGIVGRPLLRREHVHHINGDRADNRPENLELLSVKEHRARHDKYFRSPTHRECGRCRIIKPRSEFFIKHSVNQTWDTTTTYCKKCQADITRAWRLRRKQKIAAHGAEVVTFLQPDAPEQT